MYLASPGARAWERARFLSNQAGKNDKRSQEKPFLFRQAKHILSYTTKPGLEWSGCLTDDFSCLVASGVDRVPNGIKVGCARIVGNDRLSLFVRDLG